MGLLLPRVAGNGSSTKGVIIQILSDEWPLSAKEISNRFNKKSGAPLSYQAIHKLLNSLCKDNAVEKNSGRYSLNIGWVLKRHDELLEIEKRIVASRGGKENKATTISFDSWHKAGQYLLRVIADQLNVDAGETGVVFHNHLWWILSLSPEDYPRLKKLCSAKPYIACRNSSVTDRILAKMYSQMGCRVKLGVSYSCNYDFIVYKNKIYQTYFLDSLGVDIDKGYRKMSSPLDMGNNFYRKFLEKKSKIQLVILENPELAEKLTQDVLRCFKNKKK